MATTRAVLQKEITNNSLIEQSLSLESLIKTNAFKRLEQISMLGTLNKVFPHKVQNRAEHSLEVLYFTNLWLANQDYFTRKEIKHIVAHAIKHDEGHTALSHELEGLASLDQKEMAKSLLEEKDISEAMKMTGLNKKFLASLLTKTNPLYTIVGSKFGMDKIAYVASDSERLGLGMFKEAEELVENIWYDMESGDLVLARDGEGAAVEFATRYADLHANKYFHPRSLANKRILTRLMHTALEQEKNNSEYDTKKWQLWVDSDVDEFLTASAENNEEIAMIWEDFNKDDYRHVLTISPSTTYGANHLRPDKLAHLKSLSLEDLTEIENNLSHHLYIPKGSIVLAIDGNTDKAALPDIYLEEEGAYLFKDMYKSFANKKMDELRESLGGVHIFSNKANMLNGDNVNEYVTRINSYLSTILKVNE